MKGKFVKLLRCSSQEHYFEFSLAVRQMPGDLCPAPGIILLLTTTLADGRD